jgi:Tfp pilus assembly protein PilF
MSRAVEALEGKDPALAIELLDRVTQLKPDWAEAWHRRAAAFYMLDDPADALADLHRAIASEPRHFNAWMALAHVRMASGDKKRALEAYRRALELHPFAEGARAIVGRIAPQIEGRDL